jgi:CubicO group peptidase (beta-lactamase class C family)
VGELQVEVDPRDAGIDGGRLHRLTRYLDGLVEAGRMPGWQLALSRGGRLAYVGSGGYRHAEQGLPVETGTLWRIYSMTKPVTSVAAMMLYEEGAFELTDPVAAFVPSFADLRVHAGGSDLEPVTVPAREPVRIWHLLTHTAGLTYGFHRVHPSDSLLRDAGYEWGHPDGVTLAQAVDTWASVPLLFEPGAEWNYSLATDVLGRVVEVAAGMPLDRFLAERVLGPLGMTDTSFGIAGRDPADAGRLARLYAVTPTRRLVPADAVGAAFTRQPTFLSGGGGLVSTAHDYHRFLLMLRGGGELDGVRLLGPRTVATMTRNQLPGGADLDGFGRPLHAETPYRGVGFGLGFAVVLDPVAFRSAASPGEYSWGGAASTAFWVDPLEDVTCVFMTSAFPSSALPIRTMLRQLVAQALVD